MPGSLGYRFIILSLGLGVQSAYLGIRGWFINPDDIVRHTSPAKCMT